MYRIIGGDQAEYGPVTAEQINTWILDGRANGQTQARADGGREWKPLSTFAEFATALSIKFPLAPPPPMESKDPHVVAETVLAQTVAPDMGRCLRRGGRLLMENLGLFIGATLFLLALRLAIAFIPIAGGVVNWILSGAFYGGFYLIFLKRLRGQPAGVGDLFSGFNEHFQQLMLTGIVSGLLTGISILFCFLPWVYLTVAWKFSIPLALDKRLNFWPAMELSRKVISRYWFQIFGLMLVAYSPVVLFSFYVFSRVYQISTELIASITNSSQFDAGQLASLASTVFPLMLGFQLVMLFTLPFASAVMMQAYEDLFGTRSAPTA